MSLADPTQSEDILLDSEAVPIGRPIMFGDVFTDVACSRGGPAERFVMVLSHPCSMRRGATLKERVLTARISRLPQKVSHDKWATGFFDHFPLLTLEPGSQPPFTVELSELHSASSAEFNVQRRVLALSDHGVTVLLQRWIFQMSRDPVPLGDLELLIAPVMAEVELQELWCEARPILDTDSVNLQEVLSTASAEFQEFLGKLGDGGIRDQLQDPARRATARRSIREEIRRRFQI